MLKYEDLPGNHEDLAKLAVEFPSLNPDETARHEGFVEALVDYLVREGEDVIADDVTFLRSAQVADKKYWIWELFDEVGRRYYATADESPNGTICLGFDPDDGLSPEQFLLGAYYGCY